MNKEQIYTQQRIINKQNKRIKELEEELKGVKAMCHFAEVASKDGWRRYNKLLSATLFQRIFQWKKL